jgi:hypothetical protein
MNLPQNYQTKILKNKKYKSPSKVSEVSYPDHTRASSWLPAELGNKSIAE